MKVLIESANNKITALHQGELNCLVLWIRTQLLWISTERIGIGFGLSIPFN